MAKAKESQPVRCARKRWRVVPGQDCFVALRGERVVAVTVDAVYHVLQQQRRGRPMLCDVTDHQVDVALQSYGSIPITAEIRAFLAGPGEPPAEPAP